MVTNQDKVKELIGEAAYDLLIANGFFPIESELLTIMLSHKAEIEKLSMRLSLVEQVEPNIIN